ncbi:unnamed protein product [Calypogeia fissa]
MKLRQGPGLMDVTKSLLLNVSNFSHFRLQVFSLVRLIVSSTRNCRIILSPISRLKLCYNSTDSSRFRCKFGDVGLTRRSLTS